MNQQLHLLSEVENIKRGLEWPFIAGGSAAFFQRDGYTFDVGSSIMFGFGDQGTTNLLTKALESVGKKIETVPDPTQVHYHLPKSKQFPEVSSPAVQLPVVTTPYIQSSWRMPVSLEVLRPQLTKMIHAVIVISY